MPCQKGSQVSFLRQVFYFMVEKAETISEVLPFLFSEQSFVSLIINSVSSYHQKTKSWSSMSALHGLIWLLWSYFGSVFSEWCCTRTRPVSLAFWWFCSFSSPWLNLIYTYNLFSPATRIACAFLVRGQLHLVTWCISVTWLDSTETPRTANLQEPVKKGKRKCKVRNESWFLSLIPISTRLS